MNRLLIPVLAASLLFLPVNRSMAESANVSQVTKGLMCTCGCTMVLYSCQCGTADQMTQDIRGMLDDGMSKEEILDRYVAEHGKAILAAPPKEGFNLSAWILPFAALGIAAILIVVLLRRWRRSGRLYDPPDELADTAYMEEIERELESIEE